MNKTIEKFQEQLIESILASKTKEDLLKFESIISDRREWIESYSRSDKKELIQWIIEKDKEIVKLLQEKMETYKEKILKEEEQNRNRGTFKLYE